MAVDTFVGLSLDQSIQGAQSDDGNLTWLSPTYLVGDGNGSVKISGVPGGFAVAANATVAGAMPESFEIYFTPGSGRAAGTHSISIMLHAAGSSGSAYGGTGILLRAHAGGNLILTDGTGGGAPNAQVSGVSTVDTQQYCMKLSRTSNANRREYVGEFYNASGGVKGSLIATTPTMTIAAERPSTAKLLQIWQESAPNIAIAKVATTEAANSGGSTTLALGWTEGADAIAIAGTVASASAGSFSTPVLRNNTGTILANETGVVVNVYNATTGALVVRKTGLTSNASGVVTVSDPAIIAGTSYAYEVVLTANGRRLPLATAA